MESTTRTSLPGASRVRWVRRIALLGAVLGASLLAVWVWFEHLEDRIFPKRLGAVVEGRLYRSALLHPALVEDVLRDHEIDRIVSLMRFKPGDPAQEAERRAADTLGIESVVYPLKGDGTGDVTSYVEALSDMIRSGRDGSTVLVHCHSGTYRTGAAVAWYRVLVQGWTPEAAVQEMMDYDWDPEGPEPLRYMNAHTAYLVDQLVKRGMLDRVPDPLPVFSAP